MTSEKCEHQPKRNVSFKMAVDRFSNEYYTHFTKCQYCGCELKALWLESKPITTTVKPTQYKATLTPDMKDDEAW